jgi:hypothetical protein
LKPITAIDFSSRRLDRDLRDGAAGEADRADAALDGQAAQRLVEDLAAYRIVDAIDAAARGELQHLVAEIALA